MIRWNLFFEVEKVEQLALIDRLATHHDRPPSLKASGKRNHDSSISTRPFSTGSVKSGHRQSPSQCPLYPRKRTNRRRLDLPLCANSGLTHRSKKARYSITSARRRNDSLIWSPIVLAVLID